MNEIIQGISDYMRQNKFLELSELDIRKNPEKPGK
jgi:hypothetical protein